MTARVEVLVTLVAHSSPGPHQGCGSKTSVDAPPEPSMALLAALLPSFLLPGALSAYPRPHTPILSPGEPHLLFDSGRQLSCVRLPCAPLLLLQRKMVHKSHD